MKQKVVIAWIIFLLFAFASVISFDFDLGTGFTLTSYWFDYVLSLLEHCISFITRLSLLHSCLVNGLLLFAFLIEADDGDDCQRCHTAGCDVYPSEVVVFFDDLLDFDDLDDLHGDDFEHSRRQARLKVGVRVAHCDFAGLATIIKSDIKVAWPGNLVKLVLRGHQQLISAELLRVQNGLGTQSFLVAVAHAEIDSCTLYVNERNLEKVCRARIDGKSHFVRTDVTI